MMRGFLFLLYNIWYLPIYLLLLSCGVHCNMLFLTFAYHGQIRTTKNDILKLFDSIEKYGMHLSLSLSLVHYNFLVLMHRNNFLVWWQLCLSCLCQNF
jgi:hypothetical protein